MMVMKCHKVNVLASDHDIDTLGASKYLDLATGHGIGTYGTYLSIALRKINEMLMNHVLRHDRKIIKASLDSGIVKSIRHGRVSQPCVIHDYVTWPCVP
ncbi:hypothetical protein F383_34031 [Gossypium arboreum]|uniref:Uncharacterized protein n=1 Tax=Gossypium arboreum TaxID=29729 RepID=A0A0B0N7W4_GOSAR|nr:hypothetical protein F383_34031 [Gossypium arboreum]